MRLVTFKSEGENPVTCTIVSLGGIAGGLEENVGRWAQQINIQLDEEEFQDFLKKTQTIELSSGMVLSLVDFTQLQQDDEPSRESMVGAILNLEDVSTVFLKMTGTKQAIINNRERFVKLCQSIRLNHE